jgi:DNA-binding IclR family transcriptional regulator
MSPTLTRSQPSKTLAKGITILEAFNASQRDWGIRELARELGFHPAIVHRLVATLHNAGYLEQNPENRRYALGPRVMKLAATYTQQNPLQAIARKVFENFSHRFDYNFYLGTLSPGFEVIYLAALDGRGPIKIVVEAGGRIKLHTTALGKMLLALQDDEYVHDFIKTTELERFTSRTITDAETLWTQIRAIRRNRYAVNDGEHYEEVAAVAVPLPPGTAQGTASVSLAYPRQLIHHDLPNTEDLVAIAREVADEIIKRSQGLLSAS